MISNKNENAIDNVAIHKYKAANFQLKKIVNQKLNEIADPGEKRNYLTKIKVYACFLKIGEIGIIKFLILYKSISKLNANFILFKSDNLKQRFQAEAYLECKAF